MSMYLYTQPVCPACVQAKNWLESYGFNYTVIDVRSDPDALEFLLDNGIQQTPVLADEDGILATGFDAVTYNEVLFED